MAVPGVGSYSIKLYFRSASYLVFIGLGRIVALYYLSSTLYHIHDHIRCIYF